MAIDDAEISHRFTHQPPTSDAVVQRHEIVREAARQFARTVVQVVPGSREQSLAVTHIEDALMWANAGIARTQEAGQ